MKKSGILHNELAQLVASMGHTDMLVVGDAGLPVPPGVPCIDLAVTAHVPAFLDVVRAISTELVAERIVFAEELRERELSRVEAVHGFFSGSELSFVPHPEFKALTAQARAVVRTGEYTPYSNVIIYGGVAFPID